MGPLYRQVSSTDSGQFTTSHHMVGLNHKETMKPTSPSVSSKVSLVYSTVTSESLDMTLTH
jgi:hypothetical protein